MSIAKAAVDTLWPMTRTTERPSGIRQRGDLHDKLTILVSPTMAGEHVTTVPLKEPITRLPANDTAVPIAGIVCIAIALVSGFAAMPPHTA